MAILLLLGFITTSLVSYHIARSSLIDQVKNTTLPLTSDNIYSEIQRDLLRPIFISSLMAHDTFVRDWAIEGEADQQAMIRYLKEIQDRYSAVTAFFVSEKTRNYYHVSGVLKKVAETDPQDRWYFRVRTIQSDYEINVDLDTADRKSIMIFINYRVYDYAGRFIGVTGVGLAVKAVSALIANYQNRYDRQILFVDDSGKVILHSPNYRGPGNIHQSPGLASYAPLIFSTRNNSLSYNTGGHTIHLNSRWVAEFGWYLLVEQIEHPAKVKIRNVFVINLCASLVITLIVLILTYLAIGKYQRRIETMALTDPLTGLANRNALDMLYTQALSYVKRQKSNLCAIMFDIDHFKQINDKHGHVVGDMILKETARIAKEKARDSDTICRWGGEEFLALLPACDIAHAMDVAEKMRQAIKKRAKVNVGNITVSITASFGVAEYLDGDSLTELIKRVDRALYLAKAKGRDRVKGVNEKV